MMAKVFDTDVAAPQLKYKRVEGPRVVSPSPCPLPWGEGVALDAAVSQKTFLCTTRVIRIPPLPKGEDRGEGKGHLKQSFVRNLFPAIGLVGAVRKPGSSLVTSHWSFQSRCPR